MNRRLFLVLIWGLGVLTAARCGMLQEELCRVRLSLVDGSTGKPVPGVIRGFVQGQETAVPIHGLLERGQGVGSVALQQQGKRPPRRPIHDWYVLSEPSEVTLPQKPLRLEAFSGLETEMATLEVDLSQRNDASLTLSLNSFSHIKDKKWFGGNTHLHLFRLAPEEADRYLSTIPAADRLDVLFTSYLIRPSEDADYITNRYPVGDLTQFHSTGVLVNQGEEHRHNLTPWSGGYGHVMLLNIRKLIQPVSIGPGITGAGTDGIPLQEGIDEAHRQGGTTIWCHNDLGLERVVNFVLGKVDAQNIFDGLSLEDYPQFEDTFYHYLNAGLRVPFSTGTDWFLFDLARAYTRVAEPLGIASWLEALKRGRSFITNGPLFHFLVEDQGIGDTLSLKSPGEVGVEGRVSGRIDFDHLELIHNGRVVDRIPSRATGEHFSAELKKTFAVEEPGWLALRVSGQADSEYGLPIFGHTSAIYLEVDGKSIRQPAAVVHLRREIQAARTTVAEEALFATPEERKRVLDLYDRGLAALDGGSR
ncbi:MAG: CehA/McbA family metallohydrolase [Acidobacteriota bacterium]|nr:CehA/McbA family metallohydrolase [Acidobacteriota bacterium]